MVQARSWNGLRFLPAVKYGQTLRAPARQLHVDDTTVARRLAALQSSLGARVVERGGDSRLVLTEGGELVARKAEAMEHHVRSIDACLGGDRHACAGTVRVISVLQSVGMTQGLSFLSSRRHFPCSTAPQAFPRPDRRMPQAGARRTCQGWPLFSGHPEGSALTRPSTTARWCDRGLTTSLVSCLAQD
jgi:hypothetical protein